MKWLKSRSICLWLTLVLAFTLAPGLAAAADFYWVAPGDGNWWDSQNWSSSLGGPGGAGYPGQGDNAFMIMNDWVPRIIYYTPPPVLTFQEVLNTICVGTPGSPWLLNTIRQDSSYFPLKSVDTIVGFMGAGRFLHYSGLNWIQDELFVGFDAGGAYDLYGGSIWSLDQIIGQRAEGTMTQAGGYNLVKKSLFLGSQPTGKGYYYMQSGNLKVEEVPNEPMNGEFVGLAGTGTFQQDGGSTNETPRLYLGWKTGSQGTYRLYNGNLKTTDTTVGNFESGLAQGDFIQTGGAHKTQILSVLRGNYNLYLGSLTATAEMIGGSPDDLTSESHFKHSGGVNSAEILAIGWSGRGDYELSGTGSLKTTTTTVGNEADGDFYQQGGTHETTTLLLGYAATGRGMYIQNSGDLLAGTEIIGKSGKGIFMHGMGLNKVTGILEIGSQGTYTQAGGTLAAFSIVIKPGGRFFKVGSDFQVGSINNAGQMILGGSGPSGVSGRTDNLPGGLIHINGNPASFGGEVINQGTFRVTGTSVTFAGPYIEKGAYISDGATQTFTSLRVDPDGFLTAGPNSRWLFSQDLEIRSTRSSEWNTLAAELSFIPGSLTSDVITPTYHLLTVPGQDLGPTSAGFQNNFAWGRLVLNDDQVVILQDGDETPGGALYVREIAGLLFDEGNHDGGNHWITNLFSNGLNLYYDPLDPANDYLAGQRFFLAGAGYLEPAVPLPATWLLLGSGLLGLAGWRRFRKG
jgi:hypothetical protein